MTETSQTREAVAPYTAIFNAIGSGATRHPSGISITVQGFEEALAGYGYAVVKSAALSEAEDRATKAEAERDTALARIAGMGAGGPVAWKITLSEGVSWFYADPDTQARCAVEWTENHWKMTPLYATPSAALARAERAEAKASAPSPEHAAAALSSMLSAGLVLSPEEASLSPAPTEPCFECGSTERIGTACAPCNPEIAPSAALARAEVLLRPKGWSGEVHHHPLVPMLREAIADGFTNGNEQYDDATESLQRSYDMAVYAMIEKLTALSPAPTVKGA